MPGSIVSAGVKRGRPRSEQVEQAILRAAAAVLLERGLAAMTIEDVAERAGVGKASIYRRWSTKGTLALDAFLAEFLASQPLPDTGSLDGDLRAALRAWVRTVRGTPTGRALGGLIGQVQHDPELAIAWTQRVVTPIRAQHRRIIERAMERGEIPADSEADLLLDMLYGPAYHRLLNGHLPLTNRFIHQVVAMVMVGAAAGASAPASKARR
ncbi:MAG TPA: TetR/AcrR family transcriptional regulator [Acidimicrobiales bacterium]|jgi:AcrR family transcriptional regulator